MTSSTFAKNSSSCCSIPSNRFLHQLLSMSRLSAYQAFMSKFSLNLQRCMMQHIVICTQLFDAPSICHRCDFIIRAMHMACITILSSSAMQVNMDRCHLAIDWQSLWRSLQLHLDQALPCDFSLDVCVYAASSAQPSAASATRERHMQLQAASGSPAGLLGSHC